jgi:hypothetical protein
MSARVPAAATEQVAEDARTDPPDGTGAATGPAHPARAALEALAALLDPRWYITVLINGDNRVPCLTVSSRYARLTWDIYADEGWFWSAADKVAPFSDPGTAARDLADVLCLIPAS